MTVTACNRCRLNEQKRAARKRGATLKIYKTSSGIEVVSHETTGKKIHMAWYDQVPERCTCKED